MTRQEQAGKGENENLVDFMTRFTGSQQFNRVFQEGMSLVEETADYLDGPGRAEARELPRPAALAYASESMRLTTRLMQLASWLLLQRAISTGEISPESAAQEQERINLTEAGHGGDGPQHENLPHGLLDLIARSRLLHARIVKLDARLKTRAAPSAHNPVASHLDMLSQAFGSKG